MRVKNISKIIIIVMTSLMIFIISVSNYSNATSIGFISFNNAPRKYFEVLDSKLADVTMRIEDNNGISSVELYTVDTNGNNQKKINFSTANTSDSTKHIYTLSNKNLLKGKTKCFYIKIKDKSGNIFYSRFRVCANSKKVNKKTVKYYSIDDSPRVKEWIASGNNASFIVRDLGGTKYAKVQDANNGNKEIYKFEDLAKGDVRVTIDMTKFKASDGIYKLRIVTEDYNKQQAIRRVYFKQNISVTNTKTVTKTTKNDTTPTNKTQTVKSTGTKNVSSFIAALDKISTRVETDYKAGKKWKYTNGVNSENKLPVKYTFQEAIKTNTLTTNCADYVMWALHDCGIFTANQKFYGNKSGGITYKKNSKTKVKETLKKYAKIIKVGDKTQKQLITSKQLKKGDICLYKGHTNVYAGNNKFYDAGRVNVGGNGTQGYGSRTNYTFKTLGPVKSGYTNSKVTYVIRLKDQT